MMEIDKSQGSTVSKSETQEWLSVLVETNPRLQARKKFPLGEECVSGFSAGLKETG